MNRTVYTLMIAFWLLASVLLSAGLLSGCQVRTTPPGPRAVAGVTAQGHYVFMVWDAGLRVMIWDDFQGGHMYGGSGSTEDPVYRQEGTISADDGSGYDFKLETEDGQTGTMALDGRTYNLAQGGLFIVRAVGDGDVAVRQLNADLNAVPLTVSGIETFGQDNPDVAALVDQ